MAINPWLVHSGSDVITGYKPVGLAPELNQTSFVAHTDKSYCSYSNSLASHSIMLNACQVCYGEGTGQCCEMKLSDNFIIIII